MFRGIALGILSFIAGAVSFPALGFLIWPEIGLRTYWVWPVFAIAAAVGLASPKRPWTKFFSIAVAGFVVAIVSYVVLAFPVSIYGAS